MSTPPLDSHLLCRSMRSLMPGYGNVEGCDVLRELFIVPNSLSPSPVFPTNLGTQRPAPSAQRTEDTQGYRVFRNFSTGRFPA